MDPPLFASALYALDRYSRYRSSGFFHVLHGIFIGN